MSKAEILGLRSAVSSRDDAIRLLEHQAREMERKLGKEIDSRDETNHVLNAEVDEKAITITRLVQQLRRAKLRVRALEQTVETLEISYHREHQQRQQTRPEYANKDVGGRVLRFDSGIAADPVDSQRPMLSSSADRTAHKTRRSVSSPVPHPVVSIRGTPGMPTTGKECVTTLPHSPHPPSTPPHPHHYHRRRWSGRLSSSSSVTSVDGSTSKISPSESNHQGFQPRPPSGAPIESTTRRLSSRESKRVNVLEQAHVRKPRSPGVHDILRLREERMQVPSEFSPPVLPPIQSDPLVAPQHWPEQTQRSVMKRKSTLPESSTVRRTIQGSSSSSSSQVPIRKHLPSKHKRVVLADAQSLSSAPCSIQVLHYSADSSPELAEFDPEDKNEKSEENIEDEEKGCTSDKDDEGREEEGATEGMLLVRGVGLKDCVWQELHQHGAD